MTTVATVPKAPPTGLVRFAQRMQRRISSFAQGMSPPPFALLDLAMARWLSDALAAVTQLGVPDALAAGARDHADVAHALGLHAGSLYRVLRALSRQGLLVESPSGTFALTETTRALCTDHPSSMRNMVMELARPRNTEAWAALPDAIRTGEAVWSRFHDVDMWTWLDRHPQEHAVFHGAMVELTREAAPSYARAYDFGARGSICDVGGGEGQLLAMILSVHSQAKGVLVDSASVVANAPALLERWGVRERCAIVASDLFAPPPPGHGVYLAKNILHGFGDDRARELLARWRDAMAQDGRIVVIDIVVPERNEPYLFWLDLQMLLVSHGGRERTRAEFAALFASAGLELERVIDTPTPMSLIVAKRPA